jgi:hypothetical protein
MAPHLGRKEREVAEGMVVVVMCVRDHQPVLGDPADLARKLAALALRTARVYDQSAVVADDQSH